MKKLWIVFILLFYSHSVFAYEVQSLADGACWLEETEAGGLKIASFNDKAILVSSRDDLLIKLNNLLAKNLVKKINSLDEITLHCGAYGASLVISFEMDGRESCSWFGVQDGALKVRSLGGLEITKKGRLCDGHVWGELMVGIKKIEQKKQIEEMLLNISVESVIDLGNNVLRVTLKKEYYGKEINFLNTLKNSFDLRFVELNTFLHPVGESVLIK